MGLYGSHPLYIFCLHSQLCSDTTINSMAEEAPTAAAPAKAKGSSERKRSSSAPRRGTGPSLSQQIVEILSESKQRKGTSGYTIKKILEGKGVDVKKLNGRINVALKRLVLNGTIVQVSGIGASGSFRLPKKESSKSKSKNVLGKSPARKSVGKKVRVKTASTPKKDKKKKKEDKKKNKRPAAKKAAAKKPAAKKSAAKKSPKKPEQKRRAKPSPKKSGKVTPKKQERSQKKVAQRKSATSRKTSGKGKK